MEPTTFIGSIGHYMNQGGFVMPPLVLGALMLWYMVGYRYYTLNRGSTKPLRRLVNDVRASDQSSTKGIVDSAAKTAAEAAALNPEHTSESLDEALFPYYQELKTGRSLIQSIVGVAPLLGLLGTVVGMIETFDSLGDMTLFASSGGIAGGISQALFSTQMGLCVAVPGVIAGRLLDRRQERIEDELDQLKAIVGASL